MSDTPMLDRTTIGRIFLLFVLLAVIAAFAPGPYRLSAQPAAVDPAADDPALRFSEAEKRAQEALAAEGPKPADASQAPAAPPQVTEKINLWELYLAGGVLMVPITIMSFIAVAFGVERALGLRRRRVLPPRLLTELRRLSSQSGGIDPRQAFWLCLEYPSTAANVLRAMLQRVGRSAGELEAAVVEANEREAAKLYRNVRWLNLCATVTPLMGLLGTVQGMIGAFFVTAHLPVGANKAESLAEGIYVALVTTFGGLIVAIPAAILAHFFEGRIQRLFGELDESLQPVIRQLQRFEGKVRVGGKDPLVDYELEPVDGPARPPAPEAPKAKSPAATS